MAIPLTAPAGARRRHQPHDPADPFHAAPYASKLKPDEAIWSHAKRREARGNVQDKFFQKRLAITLLRLNDCPRSSVGYPSYRAADIL